MTFIYRTGAVVLIALIVVYAVLCSPGAHSDDGHSRHDVGVVIALEEPRHGEVPVHPAEHEHGAHSCGASVGGQTATNAPTPGHLPVIAPVAYLSPVEPAGSDAAVRRHQLRHQPSVLSLVCVSRT